MYEEIRKSARAALLELLDVAALKPGQQVVIGCSSSEFGYEIVCVRPRPKAGGSFATAVYEAMDDPVAVEFVKADAGLDIGNTMIGMHLKHVAVPLRLSVKTIGEAPVNAARTRPKLIGGSRAEYPD